MRKMLVVVSTFLALAAVGCCGAEKNLLREMEEAQEMILPAHLRYVEADAVMTAKDKEDRKLQIQKLREATQALKKSME